MASAAQLPSSPMGAAGRHTPCSGSSGAAPSGAREPAIMSAGNATSLRVAAEKIIKLTGSKSNIIDTGAHKLYPRRGTLDISRAKTLLDYEPQTSFDQGLENYYEWLQNQI